jgi:selenocysteine lyase/cysteine desulfurase
MGWAEELRREFPGIAGKVFVNIAFNNPTPAAVIRAMTNFSAGLGEGNADKEAWQECAGEVRRKLAGLVNGRPEGVCFTKNTVEGINIVAQGLRWQPGDNVVVTDQDHLSNVMPWLNLRRRGVEPRVAKARGCVVAPEDIFAAADAKTRVVAISAVQNSTGFRADLAAIGSRCRRAGMKLVVDGIQAVGSMEVDAAAWGIDAIACGGHKGLFGPYGVGFLYCSERLLAELEPVYAGPSAVVRVDKEGGWVLAEADRLDARRLEISNVNFPAIYGLHAGLGLIERAGVKAIESHILGLAAALRRGLAVQGYRVVSPAGQGEGSGIISVAVGDCDAFHGYLKDCGIVASKMDAGFVRFSFGAFNNDDDVAEVLGATASYQGSRC